MTTWQDQQPQSRRALRESERAHAQGATSNAVDEQPTESNFDQQIWEEQALPSALDYPSRATVEPTSSAPTSSASTSSAQTSSEQRPSESRAPEQSSSEEPLRRSRQSGTTRPEADPFSSPESPGYRLRDFSPETRGSSFSSTQTAPWTPPAPGSEDLRYQTSVDASRSAAQEASTPFITPPVVASDKAAPAVVPEAAAPEAAAPEVSEAPEPFMADNPLEHTLTRREIRELRNAAARENLSESVSDEEPPVAHASALSEPAASAPVELVSPLIDTTATSQSDSEVATAMAEFDKMFQSEPSAPSAPSMAGSIARNLDAAKPEAAKPEAAAQVGFDWRAPEGEPALSSEPAAKSAPPTLIEPEPLVEPEPRLTREPSTVREAFPATEAFPAAESFPAAEASPMVESSPASEPTRQSRRESRATTPEPVVDVAEPLREVVTAPEVYSAPEGHWSAQPITDEGLDFDMRPHQRDISSSDAITTSALVLPSFPVSMPTTGPVSGTGEILMTGSITLPRSLGVNGLHPSRYDRPDIDDIIDAADRHDIAPDSAPVRAVRAVSTYTSSQGLINTKRPKGNNLPMILSITAGVMMVGVVVLVVVGMIFKIF